MSEKQSTATLFYGYLLGCPQDGGWRVEEAGPDGTFEPEWLFWDPQCADNAMTLALLEYARVPLSVVERSGLSDRQELLRHHLGVEVVLHGSRGMPHYSLAVAGSVRTAKEWNPTYVTTALPSGRDPHHLLKSALKVLGMTPIQSNPAWILAAGER